MWATRLCCAVIDNARVFGPHSIVSIKTVEEVAPWDKIDCVKQFMTKKV